MPPPCLHRDAPLSAGYCPTCDDGPCRLPLTVAEFAARNDVKRRDAAGLARFLRVEQEKRP